MVASANSSVLSLYIDVPAPPPLPSPSPLPSPPLSVTVREFVFKEQYLKMYTPLLEPFLPQNTRDTLSHPLAGGDGVSEDDETFFTATEPDDSPPVSEKSSIARRNFVFGTPTSQACSAGDGPGSREETEAESVAGNLGMTAVRDSRGKPLHSQEDRHILGIQEEEDEAGGDNIPLQSGQTNMNNPPISPLGQKIMSASVYSNDESSSGGGTTSKPKTNIPSSPNNETSDTSNSLIGRLVSKANFELPSPTTESKSSPFLHPPSSPSIPSISRKLRPSNGQQFFNEDVNEDYQRVLEELESSRPRTAPPLKSEYSRRLLSWRSRELSRRRSSDSSKQDHGKVSDPIESQRSASSPQITLKVRVNRFLRRPSRALKNRSSPPVQKSENSASGATSSNASSAASSTASTIRKPMSGFTRTVVKKASAAGRRISLQRVFKTFPRDDTSSTHTISRPQSAPPPEFHEKMSSDNPFTLNITIGDIPGHDFLPSEAKNISTPSVSPVSDMIQSSPPLVPPGKEFAINTVSPKSEDLTNRSETMGLGNLGVQFPSIASVAPFAAVSGKRYISMGKLANEPAPGAIPTRKSSGDTTITSERSLPRNSISTVAEDEEFAEEVRGKSNGSGMSSPNDAGGLLKSSDGKEISVNSEPAEESKTSDWIGLESGINRETLALGLFNTDKPLEVLLEEEKRKSRDSGVMGLGPETSEIEMPTANDDAEYTYAASVRDIAGLEKIPKGPPARAVDPAWSVPDNTLPPPQKHDSFHQVSFASVPHTPPPTSNITASSSSSSKAPGLRFEKNDKVPRSASAPYISFAGKNCEITSEEVLPVSRPGPPRSGSQSRPGKANVFVFQELTSAMSVQLSHLHTTTPVSQSVSTMTPSYPETPLVSANSPSSPVSGTKSGCGKSRWGIFQSVNGTEAVKEKD